MKDPDTAFALLSNVLRRHAANLSIKVDEPGHLYVELPLAKPRDKPRFFGAVQIKKSYVSYHLMPVYEDPGLLAGISDALRKKMQGKSCFNFDTIEPPLMTELSGLVKQGANRYKAAGKL